MHSIHASKSAPSNIIGTIIKNLKNTNILPIFIPLKSLESYDVCYIIIFCSLYKLIIPVLFVHFYFKNCTAKYEDPFPPKEGWNYILVFSKYISTKISIKKPNPQWEKKTLFKNTDSWQKCASNNLTCTDTRGCLRAHETKVYSNRVTLLLRALLRVFDAPSFSSAGEHILLLPAILPCKASLACPTCPIILPRLPAESWLRNNCTALVLDPQRGRRVETFGVVHDDVRYMWSRCFSNKIPSWFRNVRLLCQKKSIQKF